MHVIYKKEVSNLHEDVHRHTHELGESASLGLPDRRLGSLFNAISGVGYLGAFTLRCALLGWCFLFHRGRFGGHDVITSTNHRTIISASGLNGPGPVADILDSGRQDILV
jgi:hypothetical protein